MTDNKTPWWIILVYLALSIVTCSLFHSCSSPKVVTEHHYEEKNNNIYFRDSIYRTDSVFTYVKGDTVRLVENHYFYQVTKHTDSLYIVKKDSIPYAVPAELSKWQKTRLDSWGYLLGAVFVLLAVVVLLARFLWRGRSTLF